MKNLLISLLSLLPIACFSQTDDEVAKDNSGKMKLGLAFSPDYCYRTLKADALSKNIMHRRNNLEKQKFSFTTGATIQVKVGKSMSLESGLLFSDKGYKTEQTFKNNGGGTYMQSVPDKLITDYQFYYLDVPTKINLYLNKGKSKFFVSTGVSANLLLKEKISNKLEFTDGTSERESSTQNSGASKLNIAGLAGIGIDIDFADNMQLRIEPVYRRSLQSISDALVEEYFYSVGLNVGVAFNL